MLSCSVFTAGVEHLEISPQSQDLYPPESMMPSRHRFTHLQRLRAQLGRRGVSLLRLAREDEEDEGNETLEMSKEEMQHMLFLGAMRLGWFDYFDGWDGGRCCFGWFWMISASGHFVIEICPFIVTVVDYLYSYLTGDFP